MLSVRLKTCLAQAYFPLLFVSMSGIILVGETGIRVELHTQNAAPVLKGGGYQKGREQWEEGLSLGLAAQKSV